MCNVPNGPGFAVFYEVCESSGERKKACVCANVLGVVPSRDFIVLRKLSTRRRLDFQLGKFEIARDRTCRWRLIGERQSKTANAFFDKTILQSQSHAYTHMDCRAA